MSGRDEDVFMYSPHDHPENMRGGISHCQRA